MLHRRLRPNLKRSLFLFGPRQTGKSTLVRSWLGPKDMVVDLLPERTFLGYAKEPGRFREEVLAHVARHGRGNRCFVDEIQKIPSLLDEVHSLIEEKVISFILTGSSARKLKRGGANLLAGRATTHSLFPLTAAEIGDRFKLDRVLSVGALPSVWNDTLEAADERPFLLSYGDTYLREEIRQEAAVRDIGAFSRFLDIAAATDGEIVNFSNIAREVGVSVKTAQAYYEILEHTFLAHRLDAWASSARRRLVAHPRYYFFDIGVANALRHVLRPDATLRGRRFEQFILHELLAARAYDQLEIDLYFWRTNTGVEVDFLMVRGREVLAAVEVKSTSSVAKPDLHGLLAIADDYPNARRLLVNTSDRPRRLENGVEVVPWREFLSDEVPRICALV